jgi:hypothetical protein
MPKSILSSLVMARRYSAEEIFTGERGMVSRCDFFRAAIGGVAAVIEGTMLRPFASVAVSRPSGMPFRALGQSGDKVHPYSTDASFFKEHW